MAIAVVGYAFDRKMENGGHGIKIGLFRSSAGKVAHRQVRESRRDEQGNLHYDGKVLREKGDVYMVDCNVTGSDSGTASQPKFPLKGRLVGPGGKYEGYLPVFQGDNAGPHEDTSYKRLLWRLATRGDGSGSRRRRRCRT